MILLLYFIGLIILPICSMERKFTRAISEEKITKSTLQKFPRKGNSALFKRKNRKKNAPEKKIPSLALSGSKGPIEESESDSSTETIEVENAMLSPRRLFEKIRPRPGSPKKVFSGRNLKAMMKDEERTETTWHSSEGKTSGSDVNTHVDPFSTAPTDCDCTLINGLMRYLLEQKFRDHFSDSLDERLVTEVLKAFIERDSSAIESLLNNSDGNARGQINFIISNYKTSFLDDQKGLRLLLNGFLVEQSQFHRKIIELLNKDSSLDPEECLFPAFDKDGK